mmetsp:Transcript_15063/g.46615  ORF Transcript_15063/g.46615 Transcript_15063/m.46615 type:complete len:317 (+) Transcript_15063:6-956(+)
MQTLAPSWTTHHERLCTVHRPWMGGSSGSASSEAERRPVALPIWAVRKLCVVRHLRLDLEHHLLAEHLPDGAGDMASVEVEEEDQAERHAQARPGKDAEAQARGADGSQERTAVQQVVTFLQRGRVAGAHGLEDSLGVQRPAISPAVDTQGLWAPGSVLDLLVQELLARALDTGVHLVPGDADLFHHLVRALLGEAPGGPVVLHGTSIGEEHDVVPELLGVGCSPNNVWRRPRRDVPDAELAQVLLDHVGTRDRPWPIRVRRAVLRALVGAELAVGGARGGREAEDVVVRHELQVVLQGLRAVLEALQELAGLSRA